MVAPDVADGRRPFFTVACGSAAGTEIRLISLAEGHIQSSFRGDRSTTANLAFSQNSHLHCALGRRFACPRLR